MARLKNLIEKSEDMGFVIDPVSSEVIDISGGQVLSCQVVADVTGGGDSEDFDGQTSATLVNQGLTYTSVDPGVDANDISLTITAPGSGTHALDVTVVAEAITVSLETSAPVAATASLPLTHPVILTSVAAGTARNTTTFTVPINAAAANPGATVLVTFAGTSAAITCTVTPNDGTNNLLVPVYLSTADLAELIQTGAVTGKTVTITDMSSFRILQTATGGGAELMINGVSEDGASAAFSGGANFDNTISDADAVKAAVNGDMDASALVVVTGSGSSALTTLVATNLAGGADGDIDVGASEVTIVDHGLETGAIVTLTTDGTLPAPLEIATEYFIIAVDDDTIQFAATLEDAEGGMFIVLEDGGSADTTNTVVPATISGASVKLQKSNDGTNWSDEGSATNITADANFFLEKVNPSARYYKALFAIDSGAVGVELKWLVKGLDG